MEAASLLLLRFSRFPELIELLNGFIHFAPRIIFCGRLVFFLRGLAAGIVGDFCRLVAGLSSFSRRLVLQVGYSRLYLSVGGVSCSSNHFQFLHAFLSGVAERAIC